MDAAAELGRNPVSNHEIQPEYGDEQADAGRDCRTRLARPNSQARTRTGKYSFSLFIFPVQLITSRIGNLTRLIRTLAICVTIPSDHLICECMDRMDGENGAAVAVGASVIEDWSTVSGLAVVWSG